jgi:hypothetical protein
VTTLQTTTPDGQIVDLPVDPQTWTEAQRVRVQDLYRDVSGTVAWARRRTQFMGIQTAAQSISSSTFTALDLDTELIDTDAGHSLTTNISRWTAPTSTNTTDYYLINGYVPFNYSGGTASTFITGLRINGAGTTFEGNKIGATSAHIVDGMVIDLIGLSAGDYVQLMGWQNTGSSQNTAVSAKTPSLNIRWACSSPATSVNLPSPHTWLDSDLATADATGTSGGHTLVPFNREIRDPIRWLNRPPTLRVTSAGTSQTIAANTWTAITMVTETIDTHAMWAASPNPTRIVCAQPGLYLIVGLFAVDADATPSSYVQARIRHTIAAGGTADYYGQSSMRATGASSPGDAVYATAMIRMVANDYIELLGWQNDGTRNVKTGAGDCARVIALFMAA